MTRVWPKVLTAVVTLVVSVGCGYSAWLAYKYRVEVPPTRSQEDLPAPAMNVVTPPDAKRVKEVWEELIRLDGCTLGQRYYSQQFDPLDPEKKVSPEAGIFYQESWVAFFRRDKKETVPFLISQIPSKENTSIHIDPFRNATRGELAVYCLQFILKVNWYELQKEYQSRFDRIDYQYSNDQDLLQRIIGTKRGSLEMMDLWRAVYEKAH